MKNAVRSKKYTTIDRNNDIFQTFTVMAPQLSWLERRANNAKVTGSIPLGAIKDIFCGKEKIKVVDFTILVPTFILKF